jgi:phosphoglycerate dehydrogenase-like enzyme
MYPRILVTLPLSDQRLRHLKTRSRGASVRLADAATASDQDLAWAEIILGNLKPPSRLLQYPNIRWLHSPNVGLDAYLDVAAGRSGLVISNTRGIADDVVSEHALALLLALTRAVPAMVRAQARQQFDRDAFQGDRCVTLSGRNVHVLGYGSIARCLVRKLHGLSMKVTVYRRKAEGSDPNVDQFVALEQVTKFITNADVLINLLPDVSETRGLINHSVFEAMKPTAFFVNVGRGATVDEAAMIETLRLGRLRGAALDVFAVEPLVAESPLWTLPTVLLSPHVGGRFDREMELQIDGFLEKLADHHGKAEE